jgi:murein DD-endopeptidase MepM/ murein hydrolase activator NlpD
MDLKFFKNIKTYYVLLIPESSGTSSKTRRIKSNHLIISLIIYTIAVAFLGFIIFSVTPVNTLIFPGSSSLSKKDMEAVEQLNKRMLFLSRELESLKSTNERLKYAIMLGDSSLIDSLKLIKSETPAGAKKSSKNKLGGNIFAVIQELFSGHAENDRKKTYYFEKPVNGFISRDFNPEKGHMGIDFVVKTGTPIYASASGYVIFSDFTVKDGNMLIINHPDNYITVYKHCSALLKKERETVIQGEIIALSGNTGEITTGPHLHFEIWKNGQPIDPKKVLLNY